MTSYSDSAYNNDGILRVDHWLQTSHEISAYLSLQYKVYLNGYRQSMLNQHQNFKVQLEQSQANSASTSTTKAAVAVATAAGATTLIRTDSNATSNSTIHAGSRPTVVADKIKVFN